MIVECATVPKVKTSKGLKLGSLTFKEVSAGEQPIIGGEGS